MGQVSDLNLQSQIPPSRLWHDGCYYSTNRLSGAFFRPTQKPCLWIMWTRFSYFRIKFSVKGMWVDRVNFYKPDGSGFGFARDRSAGANILTRQSGSSLLGLDEMSVNSLLECTAKAYVNGEVISCPKFQLYWSLHDIFTHRNHPWDPLENLLVSFPAGWLFPSSKGSYVVDTSKGINYIYNPTNEGFKMRYGIYSYVQPDYSLYECSVKAGDQRAVDVDNHKPKQGAGVKEETISDMDIPEEYDDNVEIVPDDDYTESDVTPPTSSKSRYGVAPD